MRKSYKVYMALENGDEEQDMKVVVKKGEEKRVIEIDTFVALMSQNEVFVSLIKDNKVIELVPITEDNMVWKMG